MTSFKAMLAAAAISAAVLPTAAPAQVRAIAALDAESAIVQSQAYQAALTAIRTQYATQLQQLEAKTAAYQTELNTLQTNLNNAAQQANATQQTVAPYAQALQTKQQEAQQDLNTLRAPIARAQAYAAEQVEAQLQASIDAAMTATGTELLLRPQAIILARDPATANLTDEVVAELNRRVQSVQTTPPANWQPRSQGAQGGQPQQ